MFRTVSFVAAILLAACASAQSVPSGVQWIRTDSLVPDTSKATIFYVFDRNAEERKLLPESERDSLPVVWNLEPSRVEDVAAGEPAREVWHTIRPTTSLNVPENAAAMLISGTLVTSGLWDEASHCSITVAVRRPGSKMSFKNYNASMSTPGMPSLPLQVANWPEGWGVYLQAPGDRKSATFIAPMRDGAFEMAWSYYDLRCAMIVNFEVQVVYVPKDEPLGPSIIAKKHW